MDLHHKAKKRGFVNPMEMYLADQETQKKDKEDKKDKETADLKKQVETLTALVQQLLKK
jgi:hypothetical protein